MTSIMMTALGVGGAVVAFVAAGLPTDTPDWVKLIFGALNAGVSFYLGKTNTGTNSVGDAK